MNDTDAQLKRLVRWNRFWLIVVSIYTLTVGYNFLFEQLTYDVFRLHLSWGYSATVKNERALVFSMNQGGPYVVTHLVKQSTGNQGKAVAALPKSILVYQYKTQISLRPFELAKLVWIDEDGEKVSPPRPGQPVTALHYKLNEITTEVTATN